MSWSTPSHDQTSNLASATQSRENRHTRRSTDATLQLTVQQQRELKNHRQWLHGNHQNRNGASDIDELYRTVPILSGQVLISLPPTRLHSMVYSGSISRMPMIHGCYLMFLYLGRLSFADLKGPGKAILFPAFSRTVFVNPRSPSSITLWPVWSFIGIASPRMGAIRYARLHTFAPLEFRSKYWSRPRI